MSSAEPSASDVGEGLVVHFKLLMARRPFALYAFACVMQTGLGLVSYRAAGCRRGVKATTLSSVERAEEIEAALSIRNNEATESASLIKSAPSVVTFEAIDVLVQRSSPVGLVYRDALLMRTGLMLPRPDVFGAAYQKALDANMARSPRFGAASGESSAEWWRRTTRETFDAVVSPDLYDDEELAMVDNSFNAVFADLHDTLLISTDSWEPTPSAYRILSAMREWRDARSGPRIGVVSTKFDSRLSSLLKAVLSEDECFNTFDFITTIAEATDPFDAARQTHGFPADRCVHIAPDAPTDAVKHIKIAPATQTTPALPTLHDLLDIFELPKAPEDDLVRTTCVCSVYEEAYRHEDDGIHPKSVEDVSSFSE